MLKIKICSSGFDFFLQWLFNVSQFCLKEPVKRVLALTETCLVERDPATYNIATLKPLGEVSLALLAYVRFLPMDKLE